MENNPEVITKKKFPLFWVLYAVYIVLLAGAICFALSWFWRFLDVYEQTRPMHFMEDSLYIFDETETANMQQYLTNTVENPYEDLSALLSVFYDTIEGKELTFGKLSGRYSERHPVYAVLADDAQVAIVSFISDNEIVDHNFCGWQIESITLLVSPTKSFAVTVPSTMNVTINGLPVDEKHITGTIETNTPVSYVNYTCNGELYLEPELVVTDRFGAVVPLKKDETTGGLYYRISYAKAPSTMELSFDSHVLGTEHTLAADIPTTDLDFLPDIAARFPEYSMLPEIVTIPTFREYYIDFAFAPENIVATDRFGNTRTLEYDETTQTYSHGLVSNDSLQEECIAYTTKFLETYALFCAGDTYRWNLVSYFPAHSEFYDLIVSMDNIWVQAHTAIQFTNHKLQDFFAYTDNFVYIHLTIDQKFVVTEFGMNLDKTHTLDVPLWLVKMDGKWYVARMLFNEFSLE